MTPAIKLLKKLGIPFTLHQYQHDPRVTSYGTEAADVLGLPREQVFKTLITATKSKPQLFAVAILPVDKQLSFKKLASAFEVKKLAMANPQDVQRVTGYIPGGISPLGQKERLLTVVDDSALNFNTMYCSGGRRGLELGISPQDLLTIAAGRVAEITA